MINSIRLKNFKPFGNQFFELKPLTLLSGLNSTGKSSLLQSLLLLRQSYQQRLLPNIGLALNGELVRIGRDQDALFEGADREEISFEIVWDNGVEGMWRFNYEREADVLTLASPSAIPEVYQSSLFSNKFHYLQAEPTSELEPDTLILLEHPETGLHQRNQTKVGELLALAANRGIQVIIETHSEHVLNGIRVAIHGGKLDPKNVQLNHFQQQRKLGQAVTEVISPGIDRNGRIDQWPDGFFDEWDKSLEALLKPAGVTF